MVQVHADFSNVTEQMSFIHKTMPKVLDRVLILWLIMSASEIHSKSSDMAQFLAHGVTGNYAGGFRISPVEGRVGDRRIKIYNVQKYSLVIEHGGSWPTKQPPPGVLDEWVRRIIAPETEEEVRTIAFLIGRKMKAKSQGGEQARKGLKIMTTAYLSNKDNMRQRMSSLMNQAVRAVNRRLDSQS